MMHPLLTTASVAVFALVSSAQGALFLRDGDLVPSRQPAADVAGALEILCRGPSAEERAAGVGSAVPPCRLVSVEMRGREVVVVLGPGFLQVLGPGGDLEAALEQVNKTALRAANADGVRIRIARENGEENDLSELLPEGWTAPPPVAAAVASGPVASGSLSGRTIAISPGHGYYWHSTLGWITQRPAIDGLTEDIHTNEIAMRYLIPALVNMGARVLSCRERSESGIEAFGDNDLGFPAYQETGAWSTSTSTGWQGGSYRFAGTTSTATAVAQWDVPLAGDGIQPVYAFWRAGTNRATDACYTIHHTGGAEVVRVDQTRNGLTWVHLGDFHFSVEAGALIELSNQSDVSVGSVVIADAVRVGGGTGSIDRGGGTSGRPRWQEASRYWTQFQGAPSSVWNSVSGGEDNSDDVTARPRFAEWRGADAFVSVHTNAGGGTGTSSFIHNTAPSAGSADLQDAVHDQLVADIRSQYDPVWTDRGHKSANFGEVRLLSTMPGVLLEVAFHDQPGSKDHDALHDPRFRRIAGKAIARGVLRYFAPTAPYPPEPPTSLRVTQDGQRGLLVAWDSVSGADFYSVEVSFDGSGFVEAAQTAATSWSTGPLRHHSMRSFRVRAWNSTGRSFPTEVLTAGTDHLGTASLLLVQGFDRLDRAIKLPDNRSDYLRLHGDAIRRNASFSLGFDAASNEAVMFGRVPLAGYRAVAWASGEESTLHETFNALEQFLLRNYLAAGGRLLVSGAEIGWDLDANGTAADRDFYRDILGAVYLADDAGTHGFLPSATGLAAGLPSGSFDDGTHGTYDVDFPDVIAPSDGSSSAFLTYDLAGQVAGIQRVDGAARVVNLAFPLETVVDADLRAALMRRALGFLLEPQPLTGPETAAIDNSFDLLVEMPAEAGQAYFLAAAIGIDQGFTAPDGTPIPLDASPLFTFGWMPNPFFIGFTGVLDPDGKANANVNVPALPGLLGLDFYFFGFTADDPFALRDLMNWVRVRIQ